MKVSRIIKFLILYSIIGCTKQPKEIEILDFETVEVNQDSIFNPSGSVLFDSILIYRDKTDKYLLSALNLSNTKDQYRFLRKGKGPKELLNVGTFLKYKHNHVQIYSPEDGKLVLFSINDILKKEFEPVFSFSRKDVPLEKSNIITGLCLIKDNLIMGTGVFDDGKYLFIKIDDKNETDSIFYLSDYSFDSKPIDNRSKSMAYQPKMFLSPNNKHVLSIMGRGNRIEIINVENNPTIVKIININDFFYKVFENGVPAVNATITVRGLTLGGFISNDYFVFPYSGRTRAEYGVDYLYGNEIRVYNWKGILKKSFKVNRDIKYLSYNQKSNDLYAFTLNPKTYYPELVLFNDFTLDF